MKLSEIIWGDIDPYEHTEYSNSPLPLEGFHLKCPLLESLIDWYQPKRILEIGVHRGGSLCWMAECAPEAELLGVDPWHYEIFNWRKEHRRRRYFTAYDYFKRCVTSRHLQDRVTYLPMASDNAFKLFDEAGITFDFAYIDGGHSHLQCYKDLINTRAICSGPIVVDDFEPGRFDGIVRACNEFGEPYEVEGRKAVFYGNAGRPSNSDG